MRANLRSAENRDQRSENRDQRSENRDQRSENRDQRSEIGRFSSVPHRFDFFLSDGWENTNLDHSLQSDPIPSKAIAFQISLRATFVILKGVKDLQVFFLLCEEGRRSDEDGPAPSCRKWAGRQLQILRRRAPQEDKSMRVLWEFHMRLPCHPLAPVYRRRGDRLASIVTLYGD
jgi:hypothetical protein